MTSSKTKLFIVDGHAQLYKAFHAMGPLSTRAGVPTGAVFGFMQTFHRIRKTYSPDHIAVVFDPPGPTFRSEALPEYKANRPPTPDEIVVQLATLKRLLAAMRVPVFEIERFEADDVIARLARWAVENGGEACIVSVDKDLLQCVAPGITVLREHLGKIETLDRDGVVAKMGVTPEQIPAYLGLLGDASDNIPGVPGIGKKRATDLLQEFGTLEALIEAARGKTKPKFWASLDENADLALRSRELATVSPDVPLEPSWEALHWNAEPTQELREILAELEFRAMLDEVGGATVEDRTTRYATILDADALDKAARAITSAGKAAIDTETTGLDPYNDDLVGISISWEKNQAVYIPVRSAGTECLPIERIRDALSPLLRDSSIRWIAHNWRFDVQVLLQAGFDADAIAFDTMIAAYLLNPDGSGFGLKNLALERLGVQMTAYADVAGGDLGGEDDLVALSTVDLEKVAEYACQDADLTFQLAELFAPQLAEAGLQKLFDELEMPLVPVLARMELEGVRIDLPWFKTLSGEVKTRLAALTSEIHALAGRPFNINSPKQLAGILFDELGLKPGKKTTTGFSTDVKVLEGLAHEHPLPAKLLEYRQLEKLRGTYIEALPLMVNPVTGRIHTSFNQTIAATGRLSSSDPNLQNIPVRTAEGRKIRQGFIPRAEGWVLLAADYSQIELRILAHMSGDEALQQAFREGQDIHTLTASKVYHVAPADVGGTMRSAAKAINFGIVYGMTAFRLARDLKISPKQAEEFIEEYFAAYKGVREFIDRTLEQCRATGEVRTLLGRRRPVPDINAKNGNVRSQAERIAVNTPIQGTSADMIKAAMLRVDRRLREEGLRSRMILQVHDELIFDVPEEEIERMETLVPEEMAAALPLDVPVQVDLSTGPNWAEV